MDDEYYDSIDMYDTHGNIYCEQRFQPNPNTSSPKQFDDFFYEGSDNIISSPSPMPTLQARHNLLEEAQAYSQPPARPSNSRLMNNSENYFALCQERSSKMNSIEQQSHYGNEHTHTTAPYPWNETLYPTPQARQQQYANQTRNINSMDSKPNARNSHGIRLRPVSDLPDIYRSIFKFGVFNAVQSKCFDEIMTDDKNLVVSAPTGSGKTVLFELGLIRMLERSKSSGKAFKCVYVAPTKALCSERFQDWAAKFEPIGLKCCEFTGDTAVIGNNAWGDAKNATIIITTCEKWDSLTRNWFEHEQILSQIQLFLVDEVHILNESRGSTLEVVISRMKLRGSSIRFIFVSATVPNIQDVARWIGCGVGSSVPAQVYEFGEEYRPCQLTRHVIGIPRRNGQNDFQFAKLLDYKIFSTLQQLSVGKPILVFCATRKGVFGTAEQLMKEFLESEGKKVTLPWARPPRSTHNFCDKRLDDLANVGIGVHHAGLVMDDRKATEQLYLKGTLRVLIATSTLAVGVNLPAQMVVIKGVHTFQNNMSKEYSDLDIMQMLGRAGRPQFDKEGISVILCESDLEHKYRALAQGNTILESSLHINLVEHLNSEIGLKTISDVETAKTWLRSSFLYQRMQRNPKFYSLKSETEYEAKSYQENINDIILDSIEQLKRSELIDHVEDGNDVGKLSSTKYGEIMSKLYIRRTTMDILLAIPKQSNLRDILEGICGAEEFQDVKLRASERTSFNKLKKDPDIRFEMNKKVETTTDKVFLLVQAVLGGINLHEYKSPDSQPQLEAFCIFKHIARIARAFLDVAVAKKDGSTIKYALELLRCLSAKAWEDRAIVLRQIEQMGEKSIKVLAEHGITSIALLRKQNPLRIETLLNRRPPFGLDVLASVADLPQYTLLIKETDVHSDGGKNPVQVDLHIECGLSDEKSTKNSKTKKQRMGTFQTTAVLTLTSDLDLIDLRRIPTKALKGGKSFAVTAELKKPSQSVIVIITSETIAGVVLQQLYKPSIPSSEYPVLDTRPISSIDMDLVGLDDDPDFWNMTLDSSSAVGPVKSEIIQESVGLKKSCSRNEPLSHQHRAIEKAKQKEQDSRTRSDGTYECNHLCKDKTKCRHLCCREGLTQPPASKVKGQGSQELPSKPVSSLQRLHTQSQKSAIRSNETKIMKALDSIHERTQTAQNLELVEGKRLKLESSRPSKRKVRPPIEYNISFTQLADNEPINPMLSFTEDDSDDLPEAILPLLGTSHGQQMPEKLGMPFEEKREPTRTNKRVKYDYADKTTPTSRKSSGLFLDASESDSSVEIVTPVKSVKISTDVQRRLKKREKDKNSVVSAQELATHSKDLKQCLPPSPASRAISISDFDRNVGTFATAANNVQNISDPSQEEHTDETNDEFAELDAWLQSESVEIL